MDFINSYHSDADEAEVEEIQPPVMTSKKVVDVIDLDSDSDDESTVQKNKAKEPDKETGPSSVKEITVQKNKAKEPDKDTHPSSVKEITVQKNKAKEPNKDTRLSSVKEIDFIDLEDGESPKKAPEKNTEPKSVSMDKPNPAEKKIDYLNLEDSDTDMECENIDNDVNILKESASKLSDIPAGPQKPAEIFESSRRNSGSLIPEGKQPEKSQIPNYNVDTPAHLASNISDHAIHSKVPCDGSKNSVSAEPDIHSRAETATTKDCNIIELSSTDLECIISSIYRDDDRIIAEKSDVLCRIPRHVSQTHSAHSSVITSLNWCIPKFSYLFLSSSLDGYIKIWDLFHKKSVQVIKSDFGFNACKWSLDGGQIMAGGKEKKACVFDVESGKRIVQYEIYNIVTSIEAHPYMEDVFLCGTRNAILGFDVRVDTTMPIRSYFSKCEEVLDIAFVDENEFLCSTNIVSQDSADRTIMAWHFSSGAKLSNQIYLERFTCPSLKVNPIDMSFIAQSNGNYIAAFSATRPYKRKNKRYIGHKVSGYGIECDISPDGKYVVSGDAEGSVYFYNYSNTNTVFVTPSQRKIPVNRVKWHPTFYSTVITATYDGQIHIWK